MRESRTAYGGDANWDSDVGQTGAARERFIAYRDDSGWNDDRSQTSTVLKCSIAYRGDIVGGIIIYDSLRYNKVSRRIIFIMRITCVFKCHSNGITA